MPSVKSQQHWHCHRGLKLGQPWREEGAKTSSVFSVSDLMKPEQIVFISSSPNTKDVSSITTSRLTNSHFWTCLPGRCQDKYSENVF